VRPCCLLLLRRRRQHHQRQWAQSAYQCAAALHAPVCGVCRGLQSEWHN
jgi:hypothetical protein